MAELKFTKGTDEEHEIKLDPKLISATWTQSLAVGGTKLGFQIRTCFVGEGAPVKVTGKSDGGKKLGKINGVMSVNAFAGEFDVPEDIEIDDEVYFEFELSKNGLDGESDRIKAVPPLRVTNMKWDKEDARRGDTLKMSADVAGLRNGTEVRFVIYEYDERGANDRIAEIPAQVRDNKVEASWEYEYHEDTDEVPTEAELQQYGASYNPPEYFFTIKYGSGEYGREQESGLLKFKDFVEIEVTDSDSNALGGEEYVLTLADGSERRGSLDSRGRARVDDIAPGPYRVTFPSTPGVSAAEEEEMLQG